MLIGGACNPLVMYTAHPNSRLQRDGELGRHTAPDAGGWVRVVGWWVCSVIVRMLCVCGACTLRVLVPVHAPVLWFVCEGASRKKPPPKPTRVLTSQSAGFNLTKCQI